MYHTKKIFDLETLIFSSNNNNTDADAAAAAAAKCLLAEIEFTVFCFVMPPTSCFLLVMTLCWFAGRRMSNGYR